MTLSFKTFILVCPMVFLAGLVDAISGGGGLISLPAYTFAGLPIHNAIATNKISSCMGTTIATGSYIRKKFIPWKLVPLCVAAAFAGSSLGANLALLLTDRYFRMVLLVLVPFVAFYVLKSKNLSDSGEEIVLTGKHIVLSTLIAFVIGVYDGFYGPGTGTFLILLLTAATHMSLKKANGLTKVINWTTNVAALTVYLLNGKAILILGLIAGAFNIGGALIGANMFAKNAGKYTRPFLMVVLVLFYIKLIFG